MMADERKDIPSVGNPNHQARVREELMRFLGRMGNKLDRAVTVRDLLEAGVIKVNPNWDGGTKEPPIIGPGTGAPGEPGPPPQPTGLTVAAAISNLFIEHDAPRYTNGGGHARTIVYGAIESVSTPNPTFADAVELADFTGTIFAYVTNPSTKWHIWVKWQAKNGLTSTAAGGLHGAVAETGADVRDLLDALTEAAMDPAAPYTKYAVRAGLFYVASDTGPTDAPLFAVVTSPIVVGGVLVPVGVYMADAFIMNGTITNAKIANLAVDNAKIANLSVDKLIAGTLNIGTYIQSSNYVAGASGFRINGAGFAEFSGIIARGQIIATSGEIGGIVIASNEVRSANYNAGTGVGFRLGADGTLNLPNGSITAGNITAASLSAISATLGNVSAGSVRNGAYTGYAWPAPGGSGFYLGPEGFLIGNSNDGKYFQVEAGGNLYMPGMKVENGTLYFQQAAAIDTNNIVIGAVTVGTTATGTDTASLTITVPPGQTYSLLVVASFQQSSYWSQAAGATATDERNCSLDVTTTEVLPPQQTIESFIGGFGVVYYFGPATMFRSISLGAGTYTIHADVSYTTGGAPIYNTPIYLVAYMFKR